MRLLKTISLCAGALALLAEPSAAQRSGKFDNSWFWGLKAGVNTSSSSGGGSASVPTWGLDWMITRTNGGLYVTADESFFGRTITAADDASPSRTRQVRIKNMHRVGFAGVVFPHRFGVVRPYAGLGAALSIIGSAEALADSVGGDPGLTFLAKTEKQRSRASLLGMVGAQIQGKRAAFFVQETVLPSGSDFLVRSAMSFFEIGVRYNFGSSIDSAR